jgi:hypothetical protein
MLDESETYPALTQQQSALVTVCGGSLTGVSIVDGWLQLEGPTNEQQRNLNE